MTNSSTGTRWNGLRRSEFKRKPLPIARQVAWQARTPLKAVSDKRKAENRERRKVLAELRAESDGICPICRNEPIADGHELLARSAGGSITDKRNIRLIGRNCHTWITHDSEGVRWATENGWRISRFAS